MELQPIAWVDAGALKMIAEGNSWGNGVVWANPKPEGFSFVDRTAVYSQDQVDELKKEVSRLTSKNAVLESARPHWAKGYSRESVAAHSLQSALSQVWEMVGAKDQTACMSKLRTLVEVKRGWHDLAQERAKKINALGRQVEERQKCIDQLEARIGEISEDLEHLRSELAASNQLCRERLDILHQQNAKITAQALEISQKDHDLRRYQAWFNEGLNYGKYSATLSPFAKMMFKELEANSSKGDRPAWLQMSTDSLMLELYYHAGKLQKALKDGGCPIIEHSADVANICMMIVDVCGGYDLTAQSLGEPSTLASRRVQRNIAPNGEYGQKVYAMPEVKLCSSDNCGRKADFVLLQHNATNVYQCPGCANEWVESQNADR